jgi:hypothetical protein
MSFGLSSRAIDSARTRWTQNRQNCFAVRRVAGDDNHAVTRFDHRRRASLRRCSSAGGSDHSLSVHGQSQRGQGVEIIEGTGHMVLMEQASKVDALIKA